MYCSPLNQVKYGKTDGTCYSKRDLQEIAKQYNNLSKDHKIPLNLPKDELHDQLEKAFQMVCSGEFCWAEKMSLADKMTHVFRPKKPQEWNEDRYTWLNTYDILFVMQQYEELHKDFTFLGVHPIDFAQKNSTGACIGDILCNFHVDLLQKTNKPKFGMILNLDPHYKGGSHWVSMYACLDPQSINYGIHYYDSVATPPPKEAIDFMKLVKKQVKDRKFNIKVNTIQKQTKGTECGMFSIVFLTQCLKNVPFKTICKRMMTDDDINKLRDVIYTPSNSSRPINV